MAFENCNLDKVELSGAKLKTVDLRTSDITNVFGIHNLGGAIIGNAQLMSLAPRLAAEYKIIVKD